MGWVVAEVKAEGRGVPVPGPGVSLWAGGEGLAAKNDREDIHKQSKRV